MRLGLSRAAVLVASSLAFAPALARADEPEAPYVIEKLGEHPKYVVEFQADAGFGYAGPFSRPDAIYGFSFTLNLADGLVTSINDSVAIGAGFQFNARADTLVPVFAEWNFWFSDSWSMYVQPGAALAASTRTDVIPVGYLGARWLFNSRLGLTLRAGYPDASLAFSMLL
jgi:hypothetical protein